MTPEFLGLIQLATLLIAIFLGFPIAFTLIILAAMLTINRSILFHRTSLAALLDAMLVVGGWLFALLLMYWGGGWVAALFAFLLVQALFSLLPGNRRGTTNSDATDSLDAEIDPFSRSHRQAEAALERIMAQSSV